MNNLPAAVLNTFQKLKKDSDYRLSLKVINNKFYLYRESVGYSRDTGRTRHTSEYLGRIFEDGEFKGKKQNRLGSIERLEDNIRLLGGRIVWDGDPVLDQGSNLIKKQALEINEYDKKILTCLSMNCRMSFSKMSKIVGLSPQSVYTRIEKLEKELGVRYVAAIGFIRFWYVPFLIFVKFDEGMPDINKLEAAFRKEPRVHFAGLTNGTYDIIGEILAEDINEANNIVANIRTGQELADCNSLWEVVPYFNFCGFTPHREEFIDKVVKTKVWSRTKVSPKLTDDALSYREFVVLQELNKNCRTEFVKIDNKYSLPQGTSRYTYEKLKKENVISRPTITIKNLNIKYIGVITLQYTNMKAFEKTKNRLASDIIEDVGIIDKYTLVGGLGSPTGIIMFMPIKSDRVFYDEVNRIKDSIEGVKIETSIISTLLVGEFGYRKFDPNYFWELNNFLAPKLRAPNNRTDYD